MSYIRYKNKKSKQRSYRGLAEVIAIISLFTTVLFSYLSWQEARLTRLETNRLFFAEKAPNISVHLQPLPNQSAHALIIKNEGNTVANVVSVKVELLTAEIKTLLDISSAKISIKANSSNLKRFDNKLVFNSDILPEPATNYSILKKAPLEASGYDLGQDLRVSITYSDLNSTHTTEHFDFSVLENIKIPRLPHLVKEALFSK